MIDEKQIEQNWNELTIFIEDNFDGEREEGLLNFYNTYADRIATAPASGQIAFHSCFIGGYVHHVLNMIKCTQKVSDLWMNMGGHETYTQEELHFACLNHDLGKIGNLEYEQYIPVTDQWKINRGQLFEGHPQIDYMLIQDRSIFLLQSFGIKMTQNEYLGIKLHDGLYDDGNKAYYINYDVRNNLRTMLPHVMHWGDMMATKLEYEQWANSSDGKSFINREGHKLTLTKKYPTKKSSPKTKPLFDDKKAPETAGASSFDDLFGDVLNMNTKKAEK